jgi:hypothetical protein
MIDRDEVRREASLMAAPRLLFSRIVLADAFGKWANAAAEPR